MIELGKLVASSKDVLPALKTQQCRSWLRNESWWLGILLFASVVWTFLPAVHNDFVGFDDPLYVTGNFHVQQGLNWENLKWALSSGEAANWHPITWLSHILDYELFGLQAWGHHLTSLILHAISTVLLFLVLNRMSGMRWRSFMVALFFGLHPLRVESVAWAAERKDVLGTFFWMLTLWAYVNYVESKLRYLNEVGEIGFRVKARKLHAQRFYALTLLFFTLGLMSKPMLVTLPFTLLLLDYWPLDRLTDDIPKPEGAGRGNAFRTLLWEKLPFFLLAAVASVVTFVVQRSGGALVEGARLSHSIANALVAYCRYLGKLFWPVDLTVFYPPVAAWPIGTVVAAAVILAGITLLAVVLVRHKPWLFVGWFWFLGTLMPVIGLVPAGEQSMADRYSYVPSIGILVMLIWSVCDLAKRWLCANAGAVSSAKPLRTRFIFGAGLAATAVLCAGLTRRQISYWKDTETLFRHAIEVTKNNYLAHNNVGTALDKKGRPAEAIQEFHQALRDKPNYPEAYNNLGVALGEEGQLQEALNQYMEAVRLKPGYADPHNNAGTILEKLGKMDEAITQYKAALRLRPDYADAHNNLGAALGRKGRLDEAITEFQQVLKLQPKSADAHNNLGVALEAKGSLDAAIGEFMEAIRLQPDYARAHFNLGGALTQKGQFDAAIGEFQNALRLKPDYAAAQTNLAVVREMKQRSVGEPQPAK